jgi:FKBP-type peptidyl-prolyl cis-trans isomerase 2
MATAKQGDRVKIHYTGRLQDGRVFDTSRERDPLEFEAGSQDVIPGISHAVVGMDEGVERTITVAPEDAFGPRNEAMVQEVPRSALPEDVSVGDPLSAKSGEQEVRVFVAELDEEKAVIDGNHPLAGHTLEFDVELVAVVPGGEEEASPEA